MDPYQYDSLTSTDGDEDLYIRLLTLPSGPRDGTVSCEIKIHKFSEAPEYRTVSYRWGDPNDRGTIHVTSISPTIGDRSLDVPKSIIPFLLRTRVRGETPPLWIDSICINQANKEEKEKQVRSMGKIYQRAKLTMMWIGPAADRSDEALDFAKKLNENIRHRLAVQGGKAPKDQLTKDVANIDKHVKVGSPKLEAYFDLLERPYFERAWIVQEIVLSQNPWIVCGDASLPWLSLFCSLVYLQSVHVWVFEFYPSRRSEFLATLRLTQHNLESKFDIEWYMLLLRHRSCQATDSRDKVYAFWNLHCMEQFKRLDVKPEYSEGVGVKEDEKMVKLCKTLAIKTLRAGDANILRIPRIVISTRDNLQHLQLPSWVPDWRFTDDTPRSLMQSENVIATWKDPYAATCGSTFKEYVDYKLLEPEDSTDLPTRLQLTGFQIAEILQLSPKWDLHQGSGRQTLWEQASLLQWTQHQIIDWEDVVRPPHSQKYAKYEPTGETKLDAMYRMLTAGILLNDSESETRVAIDAFERRQRFLRIFPSLGIHQFVWPYFMVVLIMQFLRYFGINNPEFTFRVMVPCMINRSGARLRGMDGKEYLALVPGLSHIGDRVVLVKGLNAPLVLRRSTYLDTRDSQETRDTWELIGDCYVHGAMKGELWKARDMVCEDLIIV
ncbi:heterokaryon incompatibility protein-domain-containing protein [Lophiotrema nucula]|uniref:Heterokaryon incompatibility protein-domain-containing protein n=1 Tax=Lophiotrema nucula TaxID=690887 RepID=A0A6A5YJF0_9PLEO|nr:heterokaryon incompatibility protein-domain-containing protein [Lophiotrema nucula]